MVGRSGLTIVYNVHFVRAMLCMSFSRYIPINNVDMYHILSQYAFGNRMLLPVCTPSTHCARGHRQSLKCNQNLISLCIVFALDLLQSRKCAFSFIFSIEKNMFHFLSLTHSLSFAFLSYFISCCRCSSSTAHTNGSAMI